MAETCRALLWLGISFLVGLLGLAVFCFRWLK